MPTAIVEREELQNLIKFLPDEKIPEVISFVKDFYREERGPNDETIAAILEGDAFAREYFARFPEEDDTQTAR